MLDVAVLLGFERVLLLSIVGHVKNATVLVHLQFLVLHRLAPVKIFSLCGITVEVFFGERVENFEGLDGLNVLNMFLLLHFLLYLNRLDNGSGIVVVALDGCLQYLRAVSFGGLPQGLLSIFTLFAKLEGCNQLAFAEFAE